VSISYFFTLVPLNADSAPAIDLASTCAAVALTLRLWQHWRSQLPQPWVETRYETLVVEPRSELGRVLSVLGLPFEQAVLAPTQRHSSRGVRTPTYSDVTQPLYTRAIGRWHNYAPWLEPHLGSLSCLISEFGYGST